MEPSPVVPPNGDGSGAKEADSSHPNKISLTEAPGEDQNTAGNEQQRPRDAFDDKIDELQQRLIALTTDNSPSRSSIASFTTAQEQLSPMRPSQKALGKLNEEKPPKQSNPLVSPPLEEERHNIPVTQTSTRPTTSHRASTRPSTRRGSTAPTSQVPSASSSRRKDFAPTTRPSASATSSRRSSFLLSPPAAGPTTRPTRGHRRSNTTWPPPTFIPDRRQALRSLSTFSALRNDVFTAMQAESLNSRTTLPRPETTRSTAAAADIIAPTSFPTNLSSSQEIIPSQTDAPQSYINHVPASNIDWTLPSTRRREYLKIDKARRGLRGFIRRLTPRFLRRDGRVGFCDDGGEGKGSESGTVRRYRMDVDGDQGDGDGGEGDGDGHSVDVDLEEEEEGRKTSAWWKVGKTGAKGKGKK